MHKKREATKPQLGSLYEGDMWLSVRGAGPLVSIDVTAIFATLSRIIPPTTSARRGAAGIRKFKGFFSFSGDGADDDFVLHRFFLLFIAVHLVNVSSLYFQLYPYANRVYTGHLHILYELI